MATKTKKATTTVKPILIVPKQNLYIRELDLTLEKGKAGELPGDRKDLADRIVKELELATYTSATAIAAGEVELAEPEEATNAADN